MPLQKNQPFDLFQLAKKYAWDPQAIELAFVESRFEERAAL